MSSLSETVRQRMQNASDALRNRGKQAADLVKPHRSAMPRIAMIALLIVSMMTIGVSVVGMKTSEAAEDMHHDLFLGAVITSSVLSLGSLVFWILYEMSGDPSSDK